MRRRVTNTFYKNLLSYAVILIIPVIATVFVSYGFFIKSYKEEVISSNINSLTEIKDSFELKLLQMEGIVKQLGIEPDISAYDLENNSMTAIQLSNKLAKYVGASVFINDIFFYVRGTDSIYSSGNKYSVEYLLNYIYNLNDEEKKLYTNVLNTAISPYYRGPSMINISNEYSLSIASFIFPMPLSSQKPYATVLFQIDEKKIQEMMKTKHSTAIGNVVIFNKKQQIFSSLWHLDQEECNILSGYAVKEGLVGWRSADIYGQNYLITYNGESDDWIFFSITPEKDALQKVKRISNIFLAVILLVICIGVLAIYILANMNYKPLRVLKEFIQKTGRSIPNALDEVDVAIQTIQVLSEYGKIMDNRMLEQKRNLRDMLLLRLIKGEFRDPEEFIKKAETAEIVFTKPFFRILLIRLVPSHNLNSIEQQIPQKIEKLFVETNEAFCFSMGNGRFVLLLTCDNKENKMFEPIIFSLQAFFWQEYGSNEIIGIGRCYQNISRLYMSYMEACAVVDHIQSRSGTGSMFFTDIIKSQEGYHDYPKLEIEELQKAVLEKDISKFESVISILTKKLSDSSTNFLFARSFCHDMVNAVYKAISQINKGFVDYEANFNAIHALNMSNSIEELGFVLKNLEEYIIPHLLQKENGELVKSQMDKIIEYISKHYMDFDFSIKNIAVIFNISGNNLCQQFKRHMGQAPIEYIHQLRMEKAKELLARSNLTLREIAGIIGYSTESSFIKRFRLYVGMTPGEYRKNFGENA